MKQLVKNVRFIIYAVLFATIFAVSFSCMDDKESSCTKSTDEGTGKTTCE